MALLILCAPVWARSSRFSQTDAPLPPRSASASAGTGKTGVEDGPGRKDARKVRDFVRNAKAAAPRRYQGDEDERPFDWEEDEY